MRCEKGSGKGEQWPLDWLVASSIGKIGKGDLRPGVLVSVPSMGCFGRKTAVTEGVCSAISKTSCTRTIVAAITRNNAASES